MNKFILHTGVQDYIRKNSNTDIVSVLLKKSVFEGISQKGLAQQLESRKKAQYKLPTWFKTEGIYYPPKLNVEQTSSEVSAQYKASLVQGEKLLDMTGGFGVDSYYFSKQIKSVFHCEVNTELSAIASHNFDQLKVENIECHPIDGFQYLKDDSVKYDWIFIDPSRRNDTKGKVFFLKDCEPNVPKALPNLFQHSKNILLKVSPLLDISKAIHELNHVKEIHIVAINNEVKELLFLLEWGYDDEIAFVAINLNSQDEVFHFTEKEEKSAQSNFGDPQGYLYEPNAAILKSGAFKMVGNRHGLQKLHQHSHLYTSTKRVDFPGRVFQISAVEPYHKKTMKQFTGSKANVTTRNFPESVASIRKKYKLKDGGDVYLFFTTNSKGDLIVLNCKKV